MPHIIVEYTSDLNGTFEVPDFLKAINAIVAQHYEGDSNRIKSRAIAYDDYSIGAHHDAGSMVNIVLQLIEGKSDENKDEMGQAVFNYANETFKSDNDRFQVSLEIRELSKKFYYK